MRRVMLLSVVCLLAFPGHARAAEQTLTFRSSHPIAVAPFGVVQGTELIPSPARDGYVVGISATVVDTNGTEEPIQNVMLHHIVFTKLGVGDYTCSRFTGYDGERTPAFAQRFYAEGEERTTIQFPAGYGYPNRGSDRWGMIFMLMNHRAVADQVYVQYTVRYVTDEPLTAVKPVWLDVRNCNADPIFSVRGGGRMFSAYSQSSDFVMPESGTFVAGGAHLHGGGLRIEARDATCSNRLLFRSEPTWGLPVVRPILHENGPKHMTTFAAADGIPVHAGDRLRLTATYDNSLPHTRVMGIMVLYLAPEQTPACAPAPAIPRDSLSAPGAPPAVTVPLPTQPQGPARHVLTTWLRDFSFDAGRVTVGRGTRFRWTFAGPSRHDVTLANGPAGFASPSRSHGSFSYRFTRPGVYRLFCSLHPTQMSEIVEVR